MDKQTFLLLLPNTISIIVSLAVYIFTLRRREVSGAWEFSWYTLSSSLFTLLYTFEVFSVTLERKLIWGNLRFVVTLFGPLAFINFALIFTRRKRDYFKIVWAVLITIALILVIILYTDDYHHLVYPEGSLAIKNLYSTLSYQFTIVGWIFIFYGYAVGLWGLLLLISAFIQAQKPFRSQIFAVVLSTLMPLIGVAFSLSGINLFGQMDLTPVASALSNIIIAFALFRFGLFDIVPVARDMLIEKMRDTVLVFDDQNRIVDANPAALAILVP